MSSSWLLPLVVSPLFYEGMDYQNKQIIDASYGGSITSKIEDQAYRILEELSQNSFNYTTSSTYDRANVSFKKEVSETC